MKPRRLPIVLAIMLLLSGTVLAAPPDPPTPLPDSINTPSFGYVVRYIDDDPMTDADFFSQAQAQRIADALNNSNVAAAGNPNGYHVGYNNLGFLDPSFGDPVRSTFVFDCAPFGGCDRGNAPSDRINMPAPTVLGDAERCLRGTMGHELFHHTQYAYITFNKWQQWGSTAVEGTARMMQDKIFSDLDSNSPGGCITYNGEVTGFLGNPNQDIWQASYGAALFWTYLAEQLGTTTGEPQLGADFVRTFWERAQANNSSPDTVNAVREAIDAFNTSETLENIFQDFTIANYTKGLNLNAIANAGRYRYRDDNDGNGTSFSAVATTNVGALPPTRTGSASVSRWGATYLEADTSACPAGVIGFQSTGDAAAYGLVVISGTNSVQRIYKSNTSTFARALLQRDSGRFTRLGAIVTGRNDGADIDYTFDCGQARLQIIEPTVGDPARVGELIAPDRFLIRLRVIGPSSLGDPSVERLDKSDFQVFVGSETPADAATVISAAPVQGEYWIVAQAPTKPASSPTNLFNLIVRLGDLATDTKEGSVLYEKLILDQVLVVDRSGSMTLPAAAPKIDAAQNAARLFVDSARSDDQLAVVSFAGNGSEPNEDATLDRFLKPIDDGTRDEAQSAIDGISADGLTSIGDGMFAAHQELVVSGRGRPEGEDWIVLMSDGLENEARLWSAVSALITGANIKVNAIALGPLTDQPLLQSIASVTGGKYYYVDVPPGLVARQAGPQATILDNGLSDAYALALERMQRHTRIWERSGNVGAGGLSFSIPIVEGGVEDALFKFAWNGGTLGVQVLRPGGAPVVDGVGGAEIFNDGSHVTVRVGTLTPGTWTVNLSAAAGSPNFLGSLSGRNRQGAELDTWFGQYTNPSAVFGEPPGPLFVIGQPMPILASLGDSKGPIAGATISATVEHPDGSSLTLPLFDDGSHGDGTPGDGIYGGVYRRTTQGSQSNRSDDTSYSQRGSYPVTLNAVGTDNFGAGFERIAKGAFSIFEPREQAQNDKDQDGMPDNFEGQHACLDAGTPDSDQDPDLDGLASKDEYDKFGTLPCDPDSDAGGESDGSEANRGANPLDPKDDALPTPIDVEVIDYISDHLEPQPDLRPNANLIRYPANPAYAKVRLLRSTSPTGPFAQVAEFDAQARGGLYHDEGLTNGTTYYYRLQGVNLAGGLSAPSHVFSGTPKGDPVPPKGHLQINRQATYADSLAATLTLDVDPEVPPGGGPPVLDVAEVLISNRSDFAGASYQTFSPTKTWTLAPDPRTSIATVFVRFRDAAGNESQVYHDEIISRASPLGSIRIRLLLRRLLDLLGPRQGADPASGVFVTLGDETGIQPAISDGAGSAQIASVPPGSYVLQVEYPGYGTLRIPVTVRAGETTDLGAQTLQPGSQRLPLVLR
jgi:Mg-chelatase subunit ChlD